MGVQDGFPVSAGYTNPRFISKNTDDVMPFGLGFTFASAGPNIASIQAAVNKLYTASGASESATGTVYNATAGTISNGQNYQTALTVLANKFAAATGHQHTGNPGDGPILPATSLTGFSLLGYIQAGTTITGANGSSTDVSSLMSGKSPSTDINTPGVCVDSDHNKIRLFSATTATAYQELVDNQGNIIYGRLTYLSSVWTLSYYSEQAGTETDYSGFSSQNLYWYFQELFYPNLTTSIYNPVMDLFVSALNINPNVGTFGSASESIVFTVNAKGVITAVADLAIQIAESQVTNLVSDLAGKQPVGNYITSLVGGVTASGPGASTATVVTNADLTGPITSVGNGTSVASQTGTGSTFVMSASPTLTGTINLANLEVSGNSVISTNTNGDIELLANGSGYIKLGNNNSSGNYPPVSSRLAVGYNFTDGASEIDFFNTQVGSPTSFNFYQQTGTSAATLLVSVNLTSSTFFNTLQSSVADGVTGLSVTSGTGSLSYGAFGTISFLQEAQTLTVGTTNSDPLILRTNATPAITIDGSQNSTFAGAINSSSAQSVVSGSVSGTATYSQPFRGSSYKKVVIYLTALNGTASYTFPTSFTNTPVVMSTNGLATTIVTSLSTSAVTVTGVTTTGFLFIEGY